MFSGKKLLYGLKEAPKSLNFLSKCNVKKTNLRAWRQEKGTLKVKSW